MHIHSPVPPALSATLICARYSSLVEVDFFGKLKNKL
jgi:hypothetical protein